MFPRELRMAYLVAAAVRPITRNARAENAAFAHQSLVSSDRTWAFLRSPRVIGMRLSADSTCQARVAGLSHEEMCHDLLRDLVS